jgi:hypothetical protein
MKERLKKLMKRVRKKGGLPSSSRIVDETFERLGYTPGNIQQNDILENFNDILREIWEETLVTLEEYEERSYATGIVEQLIEEFPEDYKEAERVSQDQGFKSGVLTLFNKWYLYLRLAFLSVGQSRKQRGGKDFELQVEKLLDIAEIPYIKQERQNRTDLVLPDVETFNRNRNIAVVVSLKRTLRERWAEVAEELFNLRSPNIFLFTADENVTGNHVNRICGQYNIHLVVWDSVKEEKFQDRALVLGYTEWATKRLPILMANW